jgi:hypothetical protein
MPKSFSKSKIFVISFLSSILCLLGSKIDALEANSEEKNKIALESFFMKKKEKKLNEKLNQQENMLPQKEYVYLYPTPGYGFFGEFLRILGALYLYDTGMYAGVKIDFSKCGSYYDPARGGDWWEYYFKPVNLGNPDNAIPFHTRNGPNELGGYDRMFEFGVPRKTAYQLIKKYISPNRHIKNKVKAYLTTHFKKNYIIGVHYRGTDKFINEAPFVPYEDVAKEIDDLIKIKKLDPQIFVATDEQSFLDFMISRFPGKIIYYEEGGRSIDGCPVHYHGFETPYKNGEDAVMDCLLLSKCNYLFKTSSNLSLCAAYFNPKMPMVHLSVRPWHAPLE